MMDDLKNESNATGDPSQLRRLSSQTLAAQVVVFRTLRIDRALAERCMAELLYRRDVLGDDFDFDNYIKTEIEKIPQPQSHMAKAFSSGILGNIMEEAKKYYKKE